MSGEKFYLYVFDETDHHDGKIEIDESCLDMVFRTIIRPAKEAKRKVIMTDVMDMCVFHMEDGEVMFPKPQGQP